VLRGLKHLRGHAVSIRGVSRGMSKLQPKPFKSVLTRQAADDGVDPTHGQEISYARVVIGGNPHRKINV
jgi:hypothetical protein